MIAAARFSRRLGTGGGIGPGWIGPAPRHTARSAGRPPGGVAGAVHGAAGGEEGGEGGGGLGSEVLAAVADDVVPAVRCRGLPAASPGAY